MSGIRIKSGQAVLRAWDIKDSPDLGHEEGITILVDAPPDEATVTYEFTLTLDDIAKLVRIETHEEVIPEHTVTTYRLRGVRQ